MASSCHNVLVMKESAFRQVKQLDFSVLDEVYEFFTGTKELAQMELIKQRMVLLGCEKQSITDFVVNQFVRLL